MKNNIIKIYLLLRILVWEKIFNNRLLAWLKIADEQWIVFNSLEYNSTFVKF